MYVFYLFVLFWYSTYIVFYYNPTEIGFSTETETESSAWVSVSPETKT